MRHQNFVLSVIFSCLLLSTQASADQGREIRPPSWRQDATVNDTFWLDDQFGWVVGDQGLILRTTDGGESWQSSKATGQDLDSHRSLKQKLSRLRPISRTHELIPLTCSFKSVHFRDRNHGWVAGNFYIPYLNTSRSVLLTTDDGGQTWSQLKGSILPGISRVHFQDLLGGWAIGRAGHVFKTGVFATSTGGRIWTVQDSDTSGNWVDGELTANGFIVINDEGNLGRIIGGKYEPAVIFGDRPGQLRSIRMVNSEVGWAVGSAATILQTKDAGMTWRRPEFINTEQKFRDFDFNSVHIVDEHVFVAGNPGTFIFKLNAINGDNFKAHRTNFSSPIQRIFFPDAQNGCVVGAAGLVAVSSDGGENWDVKRQINDRLAVLSVSQQPDELPLACLASYAGEQNRIVGSVILGQHKRPEVAVSDSALRRIGVGTNIELRGDNTSIEQQEVDPEQLLSELVRTIRTLRPNVLVCGQSNPELELICRTAIEQAGSEEHWPSHLSAAGLSTWQVDRFMPKRKTTSAIHFDSNTYLPRTGRLLEDQIAISLGALNKSTIYDASEYYDVESYTGSVSVRGNNVFFGLEQLGREVPERTESTKLGNLNSIATAPLKHREMKRIVELGQGDEESKAEAQSQILNFGATQSSRQSGIWLMQLAENFLIVGEQEMAASAMEQLVNRHANHAFAPAALMWLTQHYASDEVAAAIFSNHQKESLEAEKLKAKQTQTQTQGIETEIEDAEIMKASSIPVVSLSEGVREVSWEAETDANASGLNANSIETVRAWRTRNASHFLERLKQSDLDYAQGPAIQFMEAMLSQKIPGDVTNQNLLKKINRTGDFQTAFRRAASRELKSGDKRIHDQMLGSFRMQQRPVLDGDLNDDVWQRAVENGLAQFKPVTLSGADTPSKTDVCWIANDDEFLFVAVRCNRVNKMAARKADQLRTRDPDLSNVERIELQLDIDRDLRSGFRFEIDSLGRAAESCNGSVGWNPQWFVATSQDEDAWFAELAIPLNELMLSSIDEKSIAAFSIGRLDSRSVDLWSDSRNRKPQNQAPGIIAGLKVEPDRYKLLRFAAAVTTDENP